jgi:hypothetical protein
MPHIKITGAKTGGPLELTMWTPCAASIAQCVVTPHKVERLASEEAVRETDTHHRCSLRRA